MSLERAHSVDSTVACSHCGAPLALVADVRTITCVHCHTAQENPHPYCVGQEVLRLGTDMTLGRVVRCDGPQRIEVEMSNDAASSKRAVLRMEDVLPVMPLPEDERAGAPVFAQDDFGTWYATHLVKTDGMRATVKHHDESFHDALFDQSVTRAQVRVSMRAADRARRPTLRDRLRRINKNPPMFFFGLLWVAFLLWLQLR